MRGERILWIALITVLFSSLLTSAGLVSAAPKAKLFIDPSRLPEEPGTMGHPGDEYDVALKIDNVVNAWAVQAKIKYSPYMSVLVAYNFSEGDFMSEGGTWPTAFYASPNAFEGSVTFVITRLGPSGSPGVSGSGTLATFKVRVVEAGDAGPDIDIGSTIIAMEDAGQVIPIPHTTEGSYYYGPYARLLRVNLPDGCKITAGDTFSIGTKVKNEGDIPLNVTVRCMIHRAEDGRAIEIRPGQTYACLDASGIAPMVYETWELPPGEERELPDIAWKSAEDDVGSYSLTARIEYTSEFLKWNSWGSTEKDLFFWIV